MTKSRWLGLLAGLLVLSLVLAACGGDDGGGGETTGETGGGAETSGATSGGGTTITIEGFAFNPSTISVSGPTEFTIINNDSASHTLTLDDGSVDAEVGGGESTTVTIDVSETTGFVCRFHPQMTGTVEVA